MMFVSSKTVYSDSPLGGTNERRGTDHVTWGPMRGLKKTAPDGANRHTDRQTWRLSDWIGPVGPIQWKRSFTSRNIKSHFPLTELIIDEGDCKTAPATTGLFNISILVFKALALLADAFYKLKCPYVCPCVFVCVFTFEVTFERFFAPTSQNRMSKVFRDLESLGEK